MKSRHLQNPPPPPPPPPPSTLQLLFPPNSRLLKLLTCFLIFGFGLATGLLSTSTLQTIQLPSLSPPPLLAPPPPHAGRSRHVESAETMHDMTDDELRWRASLAPRRGRNYPLRRAPKVAFMFLVRGALPFAPLWEKFFDGHKGLYSIYVHSHPSYNDSLPEGSVFHGRRVPSKVVGWGQLNMMEAELRLLANALLDLSNQRFILLSEACVPLYDFPTVYSYLINSTHSFIESYDDPGPNGRGRYSPRMRPHIELQQWRKGSQWFEMDRSLAVELVSDDRYFPVFGKHCRPSCYVDEHYLPTLVNMRFGERNANRSLTWVDWSKGGPHPARFIRGDVTVDLLVRLRSGSTCTYNGKNTTLCFLFARKFLPNSLTRFMRFAPKVMGFG